MQEETREYQKVISYLSQMIAGGELAIGSRLPTERSLAETLSIGRNSTREALRMLEHTGVIVCRRGSGNYLTGNVSRPITEMVHMMLLLGQTDRKEICSFRRNMEGTGSRLAAKGTGTTAAGSADRTGSAISFFADPCHGKSVLDRIAGTNYRSLPQVDRYRIADGK